MRVAAILGSGFGLYGYLPALLEAGAERVALPVRYQAKFSLRPELARFSHAVQWMPDEIAALESADTAVLALRPDLQAQWISRCLELPNIHRLLLEKPLAPSPDAALSLFDRLMASHKVFRIGYVFRFTSWGNMLRSMAGNMGGFDGLNVSWSFLAHHFRHESVGWKRNVELGGGAIRFYGIHLIALLAEMGYENVLSSQAFAQNAGEIVKWEARFSGRGLPDCNVVLDTKASCDQFHIDCSSDTSITPVISLPEPFGDMIGGIKGLDRRIAPLKDLCISLRQEKDEVYGWYRETILLWRKVEASTLFEASAT